MTAELDTSDINTLNTLSKQLKDSCTSPLVYEVLNEVIQYTKLKDNTSYIGNLPITEVREGILPIVEHVTLSPLIKFSVEQLAFEVILCVRRILERFRYENKNRLTRNSKLICSNISTGGFYVSCTSETQCRISWYISVV